MRRLKHRGGYQISLIYDEKKDELIIDRHHQWIMSYCEPLTFNDTEIEFIDVIRDNEGQISKMRIKDYSANNHSPILKLVSERIEKNFKLAEILKTATILLEYGTH